MNTSIPINIPTTGLIMGFVDQTEILLEYSVLAKLDIPPRYDQVGHGGETLPGSSSTSHFAQNHHVVLVVSRSYQAIQVVNQQEIEF